MARWCAFVLVVCAAVAAVRVDAAVIAPVAAYGPPNAPAVVTSAAYLSSESDIIDTGAWMRTLYGVHFDEDERNCAKNDQVFYRPLKQCYVLFRRGPCQRYEWLVFDKEKAAGGNLTVVCARRKCAPNWGYDAASNSCFDGKKCPNRTSLHFTLFGDGACRCNGSSARPVTASSDDPAACFELYHPRPCGKRMILAPRYRLKEGLDAMCFHDPCDGFKAPVNNSSTPTVTNSSNVGNRQDNASTAPIVWPRPSLGERPYVRPNTRPGIHDHPGGLHHYHHHPSGGWGGAHGPAWVGFRPHRGRGAPDDDERPSDEDPTDDGDFDVEVFSDPSRSNLNVKSTTRAVVGSSNGNPASREPSHLHGQESAHVHTYGLPNVTIRLKPVENPDVASLHVGGRIRRGIHRTQREARAARGARGEANPRVDPDGARSSQDSFSRGESSWGTMDSRRLRESGAASSPAPPIIAADSFEDFTLEVQYSDGSTGCITNTAQNIICDLQMISLFSDFSEVKVPVCVNAWYRFAIGHLGKSEDCVENDEGTCVTKVKLKSSGPLDWELE